MPERFTQRNASGGITVADLEGAIRRLAEYEDADAKLRRGAAGTPGALSLTEVSYAQSRREYFEDQIAKQERRLKWWQSQKPYKRHSGIRIFDECSESGAIINYYEDAIRALEARETKVNIDYEKFMGWRKEGSESDAVDYDRPLRAHGRQGAAEH